MIKITREPLNNNIASVDAKQARINEASGRFEQAKNEGPDATYEERLILLLAEHEIAMAQVDVDHSRKLFAVDDEYLTKEGK